MSDRWTPRECAEMFLTEGDDAAQHLLDYAPIHAALEAVDLATELSLHCSTPVTLLRDIGGDAWVDVGEEDGASFQPSSEQARRIAAYLWKWAASQDKAVILACRKDGEGDA